MNMPIHESKGDEQSSRSYKRRVKNIIIHRPMQREFSFMLIALFMVASAAIAWIIHQTIRDAAFGGGMYYGKINPYQILSDVSYSVMVRVVIVLIVTLMIIGGYAVVFLHRVAGPMYRIRQTLLRLNRGEAVPEVKLREGDFFHEMAHDVNVVIKRSHNDRIKLAEIKNQLNDLIRVAPSDEVRLKAQRLKELTDTFMHS